MRAGSKRTNKIPDLTGKNLTANQISLQTIFDCLPAFIKIGDPDGNFDFFNRQWLDYTGLSLDEVKGMRWISAIQPDDVAEVAENWRNSVSTETPVYHESRVRRFDMSLAFHWKKPPRR